MPEAGQMIGVQLFEGPFCDSVVQHRGVTADSFYRGSVHDICRQAFPVERALLRFATVAQLLLFARARLICPAKDAAVVRLYGSGHVRHAAVANFNC